MLLPDVSGNVEKYIALEKHRATLSDAAQEDRVLEQMDELWYAMSPEEIRQLNAWFESRK